MTTSLLLSKIAGISNTRNSRVDQPTRSRGGEQHEKRREFRRESSERLFLQVVQSED